MSRKKSYQSSDPLYHRQGLSGLIASMSPGIMRSNYESFITGLLKIFSDQPPVSWRFADTTYPHVAFRICNLKTGRINDFLRVYPDRLIVKHAFFDERFRKMFPIAKGLFGTGDEVKIDLSMFDIRGRGDYLMAIRHMIDQSSQCTIDFSAHL